MHWQIFRTQRHPRKSQPLKPPRLQRLKSWLISAALLTLNGCATVPDIPVCTWMDPNYGYCTKTISGGDQYVTGPPWQTLVNSSVIVPADSWVKIKDFVNVTCHESGKCPNGVGSWGQLVKSIDLHRRK